ncbi:MAG: transposase [Gemmatimonadetes bacterium]|nr:transposase [Gemmatimonadota bacterium]
MHADSLTELICVIGQQMTYYNQDRRHSALSYQTPQQVVQAILMRNITPDP